MAFERLFSPIQIGSVNIRNRIFSGAHVPAMDKDGHWTEKHIKYYESKARGGVGLIVTGAVQVSPEAGFGVGLGFETSYSSGAEDWFRRGTDAVHAYGVPIFMQIWHGGRQAGNTVDAMMPLRAPSPEPCPVLGEVPKEMEIEEIAQTIDDFAAATVVAKRSGFDGVEIHGAHGYLFTQFMSATFNQRTDEYGGSFENRMRFTLQTIEAMRNAVGANFVIGFKYSGDEYFPGGNGVKESVEIARLLEATGMVDYLSVSGGSYLTMPAIVPPMYSPLGIHIESSTAIKDAVGLPVLVNSRIKEPDQALDIIESGRADMVGMTRPILCDSELPNKIKEGRLTEIRNCIACNQKCWGNLVVGATISCTLNPAAGKEADPFWAEIGRTEKKKKVLVIGAGPGGCEAARVLAERGHDVTLYERNSHLGGQVATLKKAAGRVEWEDVSRYYERALERLGVTQFYNFCATPDQILSESPDAVVIATGSTARTQPFSYLPPIEGIERENVLDVRSVLDGHANIGDRVVVYCGEYHLQGLTIAETLLERGKQVELVTPLFTPGAHALTEGLTWETVIARLYAKKIRNIRIFSAITELYGDKVAGINVFNEEPFEIPCDTLVSSFGGKADESLYFALKGRVSELHRVGDSVAPRRVEHAIFDGAKVGRLI